jgi:hypothetical protein
VKKIKYRFLKLIYRITSNDLLGKIFILMEKLTGYRIEKSRFRKRRGYPLNLKNPTTYAEKIVWKKIYDRNPLLALTADKYRVRTYIEQRLGKEMASEILIPLLYVTEIPETIPFKDLPSSYIIKANHGSGWNIIVDKQHTDRKDIVRTCNNWLKHTYGLKKHEWAYFQIPKIIIIEPLLKDEDGKIPKDYKFYIFHGTCRMVKVFSDRFNNRLNNSYDRDWNYIPKDGRPQKLFLKKPLTYDKMLNIAEKLGEDFDAVRVDLYTVGEKIFFGELTHYHQSGSNMKMSVADDIKLGSYWELKIKA